MNKVVIADKYQCPRVDGKYQLEHKMLKRKGLKTTESYVEHINAQDNGLLLIIDEQATKENQLQRLGLTKINDVSPKKATVVIPAPSKPKLSDLRKQYPHIKATSVDAFIKALKKGEGADRLTNRPQED